METLVGILTALITCAIIALFSLSSSVAILEVKLEQQVEFLERQRDNFVTKDQLELAKLKLRALLTNQCNR